MTLETLIAFLTIENNNMDNYIDLWIESDGDSIRNSCDVFMWTEFDGHAPNKLGNKREFIFQKFFHQFVLSCWFLKKIIPDQGDLKYKQKAGEARSYEVNDSEKWWHMEE